jgi:hypothetical protein
MTTMLNFDKFETEVVRLAARCGMRQHDGTFVGALLDLDRQVKQHGGDWRIRDVAVFLGEDGITVTIFANYGDDAATVSSSFELPEAVAEKISIRTFIASSLKARHGKHHANAKSERGGAVHRHC